MVTVKVTITFDYTVNSRLSQTMWSRCILQMHNLLLHEVYDNNWTKKHGTQSKSILIHLIYTHYFVK